MKVFCLSAVLLAQRIQPSAAFLPQSLTDVSSHNKQASSTLLLDAPEPLAEEGDWQAFLDDETTGLIYYFDRTTGESLWEPPTTTFPEVKLPRKTQRFAEELRRSYRISLREAQVGGEGEGSVTVQVLEEEVTLEIETVEEVPVVEEIPEEPVEEKKEGWFGSFFGDSPDNGQAVAEEEPSVVNGESVAEKEDTGGGFFAVLGGLVETASAAIESLPEIETTPVETKPTKKESAPRKTLSVKKAAESKKKAPKRGVEKGPRTVKIEIGSHVLPHPDKILWGGEDALFTKGRTFGVFDGVSGAEKKLGAPLYSKTLANEMKRSVGKNSVSIKEMTDYLTKASDYADDAATGASTAVVASIGENGFLQALNVGDSLCMVVRNGRIAAKTREISHYWECPYQLSNDSPDRPRDGTKLNVELISGDLVIMGSDGIFDNVDDTMLLDTIEKINRPNPSQLARKLCDISRKQSTNKKSITPYGKQAQRRGDPAYKDGLGGKIDDASCIVVVCK